jgi:hypothetical protein
VAYEAMASGLPVVLTERALLGQHPDEVLRSLAGYSPAEVDELRSTGVI